MNRRLILYILIFVLPLALAVLLSMVATSQTASLPAPQWLKPVQANSVVELESLFDEIGYNWPLISGPVVPRMLVKSMPVELNSDLSVSRKKALFLRILLPVVLAENQHIQQQRAWLQQVFAEGLVTTESLSWQQLNTLAQQYHVSGNLNEANKRRRLLQRVDEVPVALVLAQAANESGWGTSRFVQQANNLFGHWTYRRDQGLVPRQREDGKSHRVRIFPTLRSSVRAYLYNLNTGRAYQPLRQLRKRMRDNNQPLDGEQLAAGLVNYSERGEDYVEEIRALMRSNQLEQFDNMQLREGTWRISNVAK
jgi:Bax protein